MQICKLHYFVVSFDESYSKFLKNWSVTHLFAAKYPSILQKNLQNWVLAEAPVDGETDAQVPSGVVAADHEQVTEFTLEKNLDFLVWVS